VGEIRDIQTAGIAINAAMTGQLLLSTLHANDAATAFPRLFDIKVEPFLIASSVNVVIAQRLVRKICTHCLESGLLDEETCKIIEDDPEFLQLMRTMSGEKDIRKIRLYHGKGCRSCGETGYNGRMGIFELLEVTEQIRTLIVQKANSGDIAKRAHELGMRSMLEDGIYKVFKGMTTIAEVLRVTKL
jgi:type II secretory ATPase GspE/PulE/Tfp pilus assembly ATPase PilB-like protein